MTQFQRPKTKYLAMPALVLGSIALAGCLGPTYGTDKTSGEQLLDDLSSTLSLGGNRAPAINYAPRPDIVQPANAATLPAPQQSVTEQAGVWPEAQEQRRARIRAEIDEGRTDPRFVGGPDAVAALGASPGPARTGAPGTRRTFLTDPPTEYSTPTATAVVDDLGEPEYKKERRRARSTGDREGLRRLIPWL